MSEEVTQTSVDGKSADDKIRRKLRVHEDEKILLTRRPSMFAFMPSYFVGFCVLALHLFFGWAESPQDAAWYVDVFYFIVEVSTWGGGAGFAFVMIIFTWLNRLVNHPASGRWMTSILLLASFTPFILHIDEVVRLFSDSEFKIPIEFDFTLFGILWAAVIWGFTFWYQKSFLYAVTDQRVIHFQDFIYERDGHRLLHEDVIAVHKRRSPVGALFGYATVYCNIGDQSHIATESVGGAVGGAVDVAKGAGALGFFGKMFFLLTYQRTIKIERYTPDISLYGIRKWEEAFDLINKLHRDNSAVSKADAQLEALENLQSLLVTKEKEAGAEGDSDGTGDDVLDEVDDLLSDF